MDDRFKFRAWDKRHKRMFNVEGLTWNIFKEEEKYSCGQIDYVITDKEFNSKPAFPWYGYPSRNEAILMQSTGLRDSTRSEEFPNGVLIFEGDVLGRPNLPKYREVVEFKTTKKRECYGHGDYGDSKQVGFSFDGYYGLPKDLEIIGNIHENPELLNG